MGKKIEPITKAQIKKIWYEIKQLALTEEDFYKSIKEVYNKENMTDLTKQEACQIIDFFVSSSNNIGNIIVEGMMTYRQKGLIESYRTKLRWSNSDLNKFIVKYAHVDNIKWLTVEGASKVIEGLKNIYMRTDNFERKNINTNR